MHFVRGATQQNTSLSPEVAPADSFRQAPSDFIPIRQHAIAISPINYHEELRSSGI
jgi:hypothetical protein